jgi:hypothetical protein
MSGEEKAEGIPLMVTAAMKQQLCGLGFGDDAIAKLTPGEANYILERGVTAATWADYEETKARRSRSEAKVVPINKQAEEAFAARLKNVREGREKKKTETETKQNKADEELRGLGLGEAKIEQDEGNDLPKPEFKSRVAIREALIARINATHALIANIGGKTLIASWEPSPHNPKHQCVVFQNVASFRLRYSNEWVPSLKLKGKPKKLGDFWVDNNKRRQYRGVVFKPSGPKVINGCINLWRGWGVEPKQGDWSLLRRHIEEVIANNDPGSADYNIHWIAWAIQHPDRQAEVALVLIGHKGTGKGTLVRCLQAIFGAHAFQVSSQEHIVGRFNAHQRDCVLFIADESFWAGDKRCIGALQRMITEPTLSIEQKGIDLVEVPNMLHMIMLAELGWVVPAGERERRYAAFRVSDARLGDRGYFEALHTHIENGGAAAMLYDLQRMDLGKWHPRQVYETPELMEQKQRSLPPLEEWYVNLLQAGQLPVGPARNIALSRELLDSAKKSSRLLQYVANETSVGLFLRKMGCTKWSSGAFRGWTFRPLAEARSAWERLYGQWPWEPVEEWGSREPTLKDLKP